MKSFIVVTTNMNKVLKYSSETQHRTKLTRLPHYFIDASEAPSEPPLPTTDLSGDPSPSNNSLNWEVTCVTTVFPYKLE